MDSPAAGPSTSVAIFAPPTAALRRSATWVVASFVNTLPVPHGGGAGRYGRRRARALNPRTLALAARPAPAGALPPSRWRGWPTPAGRRLGTGGRGSWPGSAPAVGARRLWSAAAPAP